MRFPWFAMYAFACALAIYALFFSPRSTRVVPRAVASSTPEASPTVEVSPATAPVAVQADVQLALILDTSSSMDGLIQQARDQLWEMVGEMQTGSDGQDKAVALALYQYGSARLDKKSGYIAKLSDFSVELDPISTLLHALNAGGEDEHAPEAILRAVEELSWSDDDAIRKVLVIAGNEGFAQGPVTGREAIEAAKAKGIRVVPIFCANGSTSAAAVASWRRAAALAKVDFQSIDPDKLVKKVETPFDREILRKFAELQASRLALEGGSPAPPTGPSTHRPSPIGASTVDQVEAAGVQIRQRRGVSCDFGLSTYDKGPKPSAHAPQAAPQRGISPQEERLEKEILDLQARRKKHLKQDTVYQSSRKGSLSTSVLNSY
jgi:hypothetical protein